MTPTDRGEMQALLDRPLDKLWRSSTCMTRPAARSAQPGTHRRSSASAAVRRVGLVSDTPGCALENDVDAGNGRRWRALRPRAEPALRR